MFVIVFAPEVKQVFTHYTGIPLSHEEKNATMILQKLDEQKLRGHRLDTVITEVKATKVVVLRLDTSVSVFVDMLESTPTGRHITTEYGRVVRHRKDSTLAANRHSFFPPIQ